MLAACTAVVAAVAGEAAADASAAPAGARAVDSGLTVEPLEPTTSVTAPKGGTSALARTDPSLLGLEGTAETAVVVKLDYDSIATYRGDVTGFKATSPAVTGRKLSSRSASVRRYTSHAADVEERFLSAVRAELGPRAEVGRRLRLVYGGVALRVPANEVDDLLALPGAVAVQKDELRQPLTDASNDFIGATAIQSRLGGPLAGQGVVFASLDTGAWPEHPSYLDNGIAAPPARPDGQPRVCDYGDNPLTPATDAFACNDKLIGGMAFIDAYNAQAAASDEIPEELYPDSARDSDGHGTHTSTTAAGSVVASAPVFGVERGPVSGIAPGAHVLVYKVCGTAGCFTSDSAAAVQQAVVDGADVINFSISGGSSPFTDPVELAFLDAYAAGVFVAASAGNSGPDPATADHAGPWVTTVGASTQTRFFRSTVTLGEAGGTDSATLQGASITDGVETPTDIVLPAEVESYDGGELCTTPAKSGVFAGKIVVCRRGEIARADKGYNVLQGGAVGMLLYNPVVQDVETDNHWLPTVHLDGPEGAALLAFLADNPDATATFTAGQRSTDQGDVMAAFSSRGPLYEFLKPDITAPGVQILAGHTPTPQTTVGGPPGESFQAIAGTSMSAPHVAGSAALLFALHPTWTPGQVKSALMTTAFQGVTKEDGTTPADPFDYGAGRVDLTKAGDPGVTFDETAAEFLARAGSARTAIDLNLPSVHATTMPGRIRTVRVARNVSDRTLRYRVETTSQRGRITVRPSRFTVRPGATQRLSIAIAATGPDGLYFGEIRLVERDGGPAAHLPVAVVKRPGAVTVDTTCRPGSIRVGAETTCTVTAENTSLETATVAATTTVNRDLSIRRATGARRLSSRLVTARATLSGRTPAIGISATDAPADGAFESLADAGIEPVEIGDEEGFNVLTGPFRWAGETYENLGVVSNGYAVAGSIDANDISAVPQRLPDPARPNNVLAPFWTDLDGTGAPGIYLAQATDEANGDSWIVVEWQLNIYGDPSERRVFQLWIGQNGEEDVTFDYDPTRLPGSPPPEYGLTVGAENADGTEGAQIEGVPTEDLEVRSQRATPGGTLTYTLTARGLSAGTGYVFTTLETPLVRGTTTDVKAVRIAD